MTHLTDTDLLDALMDADRLGDDDDVERFTAELEARGYCVEPTAAGIMVSR